MATQSNFGDELSTLESQAVNSIAKSLVSIGGHLECMECGHTQPLDEVAMAERITHGWPKHCGYTMRWITAREFSRRLSKTDSQVEGRQNAKEEHIKRLEGQDG